MRTAFWTCSRSPANRAIRSCASLCGFAQFPAGLARSSRSSAHFSFDGRLVLCEIRSRFPVQDEVEWLQIAFRHPFCCPLIYSKLTASHVLPIKEGAGHVSYPDNSASHRLL